MLENRSFDHNLGILPGVNGLDPNWTNPLTPEGPQVQVSQDARTVGDLEPDPGHEWINVNMQIFENLNGTGTPTMKGFVEDYLLMNKDQSRAPNIMKCFIPSTLPVLSALAQQYAVCDRWFSSVPGPTIPNRLFTHAANSYGSLTQDAVAAPFVIRTIFEDMDVPPNPANYRIYTHGSTILMVNQYLQQNKQDRFFDFGDFQKDAANGYLPEYTFIEPAFDDDANNGISRHLRTVSAQSSPVPLLQTPAFPTACIAQGAFSRNGRNPVDLGGRQIREPGRDASAFLAAALLADPAHVSRFLQRTVPGSRLRKLGDNTSCSVFVTQRQSSSLS